MAEHGSGLAVGGSSADEARLLSVAYARHEAGDHADALEALRPLLESAPSDEVRRLASYCHYDLGEFEAAIRFGQAIEVKTNADVCNLGLFHLQAQQWEPAAKAFRAALAAKSAAWTSHLLAVALRAGHYTAHSLPPDVRLEVVRHLTDAIEHDNAPADAYLELERELSWSDEFDRKLSIVEQGLGRLPDSLALRIRLAELYLSDRTRWYDDTIRVVQPLADTDPPDSVALWLAFEAHHGAGRLEEALRYLDRVPVHAMYADFSKGHVRGDILLALGRFTEALEAFSIDTPKTLGRVISAFGRARAKLALGDPAAALADADAATDLWLLRRLEPDFLIEIDRSTRNFPFATTLDGGCDALLGGIADMPAGVRAKLHFVRGRLRGENDDLSPAQAAKIWTHPALGEELSWRLADKRKFAPAAEAHLEYWLWRMSALAEAERADEIEKYEPDPLLTSDGSVRELDAKAAVAISKFARRVLAGATERHARAILAQFYYRAWRALLFKHTMFADVRDAAAVLRSWNADDSSAWFDFAYACRQLGAVDDAIAAYRRVIELSPGATGALVNLSVISEEQGDLSAALTLIEMAVKVAPDDRDLVSRRAKLVERAQRIEVERRQREQMLATAPSRWGLLDRFKRQVLTALTMVDHFDNWGHLSTLSGVEEKYLPGHWRKLVELGMVVEEADGWRINEHIIELLKLERSHAVVTRVVHAEENVRFKPVFNSKTEYTIYGLLVQLFPNHLVFPNMALQTIFQYKRMYDVLSGSEFKYYLMSQVDFCITSTATYLPIIGIEADSHHHDEPDQKERDRKKDRIFELGGVPLVRLRAYGQPSDAALRTRIVEVVRALGRELTATAERGGQYVKLAMEIDFERLGALPS